ncbi:hypothetical protein EZV61_17970 [Corallincola luteus]|uniref:CBM2 domain-containing protein n=1 Tax=Corallincola luteus TaxID=1775177 RepID=A0ABY2AG11_9GAMM|nr:cellulose binding domain-containing protein [Corallincola luteus]TCI01417.1 hypothetical protein EZV61_17970 [Corallincola luteus]
MKIGIIRPILALILASSTGYASAEVECSIGIIKNWSGERFMLKDIEVTNTGNSNSLWHVNIVFDSDVALTSAWSAKVEDTGQVFTASGNDFNRQLSPGESTDFGIKGVGSFNQVSCQVGEAVIPDEPDLPEGNLVYNEDFESYSLDDEWKSVDDTRIVKECGEGREQCLRVSYAPTSRGSDRLQTKVAIPGGDHYSLVYDILFEDGFEFVRGGKLPGLSPTVHTTGCSPAIANGWSVRPMWRPNGSAQAYYYGQERIERCGDGERSFEGAFVTGRWQQLALEVKLNSTPDAYDGKVVLRVDGEVVSKAEGINLRGTINSDTLINQFFFSTFYGGADSSWAPSKTTYIRYDNIHVIDLSQDADPSFPSEPDEPTEPNEPEEPNEPNEPEQPAEPGDVVAYYTMDDLASGFPTKKEWVTAWSPTKWVNGATEQRLFVDEDVHYGPSGKSVRTLYPQGKRTSSDSGAQWHMDINGEYEDMYLSYWVKFDDNFDFVLGGKLPGLSGSVSFTDRTHEWKGRLMWREQGKVEFYTHFAHDRERWWWNTEGFQAQFIPNQWHHVEMHFRMNSAGEYDGLMEGWFDGKKAAYYDGVKFRDADEPNNKITKVFFSTFFGGSSGDRWNATKDEFAWFDEFIISPKRIGYPGPWVE